MTEYSTTKYRGFNIIIDYDEADFGETPRDWDNLGTMTCFHPRYTLGDKHDHSEPREAYIDMLQDVGYEYEQIEDLTRNELLTRIDKHFIVLPLFLYDHGGITISTGAFSCPWDSGQVGFIFASHENIKKEYGKKRLSKSLVEKATKILESEVEVYDDHLTGTVFCFHIEPIDANKSIYCNDSCCGYYGYDSEKDMIAEAKSSINHAIKEYKKEVIADYKERLATALFMKICWAD